MITARLTGLVFAFMLASTAVCTDAMAQDSSLDSESIAVIEDRFRNIIITRVSDFSNTRTQAGFIKIASTLDLTSDTIDAATYKVLREASREASWVEGDQFRLYQKLENAIALLPQTKLADDVKAKLVFELFIIACSDQNGLKTNLLPGIRSKTRSVLRNYPNQLADLLEDRLTEKELPGQAFELIALTGEHGSRLLPLVVEAVDTESSEVSLRASKEAMRLIKLYRKANPQK